MTDDDGAGGRRHVQLSRRRDTIQRWADDHGQVPVREAGDAESGRFRLVRESGVGHPGERLAWERFFEAVEAGEHVVVDHGEASGDPLEVASYDDVLERVADDTGSVRRGLDDGETVAVSLATPRASGTAGEATHASDVERSESTAERAGEGTAPSAAGRGVDDPAEAVLLTNDDVGKTVRDAAGDAVGVVTAVADDERAMFVDVDPGIATRIRSALGWERADEGDLRVVVDSVEAVTDDAVRLRDVDTSTD